jgi:hypothetical protein
MITEPFDREYQLSLPSGKLTAHQAYLLMEAAARQYDPDARFVQIASDISIDEQGLASFWQCAVDLPHKQAQAVFEVVRRGYEPPSAPGTYYLCEYIRPYLPPDSEIWSIIRNQRIPDGWRSTLHGDAFTQLLESRQLTPAWPARAWQEQMASRPPFPVPFYDSPTAVQAFIVQGADFLSGPVDMYLESKHLPSAGFVWRVNGYEDLYTPFAPPKPNIE